MCVYSADGPTSSDRKAQPDLVCVKLKSCMCWASNPNVETTDFFSAHFNCVLRAQRGIAALFSQIRICRYMLERMELNGKKGEL